MSEPASWCVLTATIVGEVVDLVEVYLSDVVPESLTGGDGPGRADWLAADGRVLASFPLPVRTTCGDGDDADPEVPVGGVIGAAIPFLGSAAELRVAVGTAIASTPVGGAAPPLRILDAPSGWQAEPVVRINWETDTGIDPVELRVAVVGPEGSQPLRSVVSAPGIVDVDVSGLAGGELWLEVRLTREVRTSLELVGPISRAEAQPEWTVVSPPAGVPLLAGEPTRFDALVVEVEGAETVGELPLRWSSDRDGELGTGLPLSGSLTAGDHRVSLQRGDTVLATVDLTVAEQPQPG